MDLLFSEEKTNLGFPTLGQAGLQGKIHAKVDALS